MPTEENQTPSTHETLGLSRVNWLRMGRCVAWCYSPMLILDSLLILGVQPKPDFLLSLARLASWLIPIIVFAVVLAKYLVRGLSRLPLIRHAVPKGLPWATLGELRYFFRTCVVLAILYLPMLAAASGLDAFGTYLISKRAEPVIDAVAKYVAVHGSPPPHIAVLFPEYLSMFPHDAASISIEGSMTVSGYNPGWWYVSVSLPSRTLLSRRGLVYCSGGLDGIFTHRSEPFGRWTLLIDTL